MKSKIIFITGGTSGIGASLLKKLHANNTVIACGRNQSKIDKIKSQYPNTIFIQADITQEDDLDKIHTLIATQFGRLDVLINNAGIANFVDLKDTLEAKDFKDIDVNFKGTVLTTNTLLPLLKKSKEAKPIIVVVSSILAKVPHFSMPIYSASKAALHSYTISLRNTLRTFQITEILPPLVDTSMTANIDNPSKMDSDKVASIIIEGIEKERLEVYPGVAKFANFMSKFLFNRIANVVNVK